MYDARSAYVAAAVETAAPARVITLLFDRLLLDVDRAATALAAADAPGATGHLQHAQDIVAELMSSLDEHAWDGGPGLMSLYGYLFSALVEAGVHGDAEKVAECRAIVAPLAEAWHEAAASLTQTAPVPAPAASGLLGVG